VAHNKILDRAEDRAEKLADESRRIVNADRYVVVVALLGAVILSNAFLIRGSAAMLITLSMLTITLVFTLVTSKVGWRGILMMGAAVVAGLAAGIAVMAMGKVGDARLGYQIAIIVMGVIIASVVARRIVRHPSVSVDTVAGAAAIYLLFGLIFSVLYAFVGDVLIIFGSSTIVHVGAQPNAAEAFFTSARTPLASDFVYYSFVTLTTVGYGDITAATQFGRMMSVCEALIGQLYLVTVVAILVSNMRGGLKKPAA
jgi:hypothetical protein